jgi:hypothetical protein
MNRRIRFLVLALLIIFVYYITVYTVLILVPPIRILKGFKSTLLQYNSGIEADIEMYSDDEVVEVDSSGLHVSMDTGENRKVCSLTPCASFYQLSDSCTQIEHGYSEDNLLYYHAYWKQGMHYILPLMIKSYLVTQRQEYSKMVVWSEEKLSHPELQSLKNKHLSNIMFKVIDIQELVAGTCIQNNDVFNKFMAHRKSIQLKSDVIRVALLNKYGGVWTDTDIVFLKDLTPLISVAGEFSSFLQGDQMNNHLLHINKRSDTGRKLVESLCRIVETPIHNLPVTSLLPEEWMFNDVLTAYCNKKLNCSITPVSRCFTDPQWYGSLSFCSDGPARQDVRDLLIHAFVLHHRLDDCGPTFPKNHHLKHYVYSIEEEYNEL